MKSYFFTKFIFFKRQIQNFWIKCLPQCERSFGLLQQMEEHTKKDLDSLRFAFKRGDAVPKFHYEVRAFSKVVICPDLTDNELEFSVQQGINLNVAKDAHTYCR